MDGVLFEDAHGDDTSRAYPSASHPPSVLGAGAGSQDNAGGSEDKAGGGGGGGTQPSFKATKRDAALVILAATLDSLPPPTPDTTDTHTRTHEEAEGDDACLVSLSTHAPVILHAALMCCAGMPAGGVALDGTTSRWMDGTTTNRSSSSNTTGNALGSGGSQPMALSSVEGVMRETCQWLLVLVLRVLASPALAARRATASCTDVHEQLLSGTLVRPCCPLPIS